MGSWAELLAEMRQRESLTREHGWEMGPPMRLGGRVDNRTIRNWDPCCERDPGPGHQPFADERDDVVVWSRERRRYEFVGPMPIGLNAPWLPNGMPLCLDCAMLVADTMASAAIAAVGSQRGPDARRRTVAAYTNGGQTGARIREAMARVGFRGDPAVTTHVARLRSEEKEQILICAIAGKLTLARRLATGESTASSWLADAAARAAACI